MNSSCNDPYQIVINWDEGAMYNFCPMQAASERDDVAAAAIKGMLEEIVDEHAKAKVDVLVHGVFSGFMSMMAYPRLRPPSGGACTRRPLQKNTKPGARITLSGCGASKSWRTQAWTWCRSSSTGVSTMGCSSTPAFA